VVQLYLDEDVNILLASLLRSRNISVTTTQESKNLGKSDSEQLYFARQHSLTLVTHNRVILKFCIKNMLKNKKI